jgi:hypothetical protein
MRSREKVARVARNWKTNLLCFQIVEKEMHNESLIAMPRTARSAALLLRQMRPSSRKRAKAA